MNMDSTRAVLLNNIISHLPVRVFWKDRTLKYLGCNQAFAEDAGFSSPEDVIGKDDFAMAWREQAELYRHDDQEVISTGKEKLQIVEPQTTPRGETIWLRTTKTPMYDEAGQIIGVIGIYEDITQQKEAEQKLLKSEQKLQAIIQNEPECVKLVSPEGELMDMNPAGLAMLEAVSLEEVKSKSLVSYLVPEYRQDFLELHQRVMAGESGELLFKVRGLKGSERWLETHAVPMRDSDGEVSCMLGLTRDITKRKAYEERIEYLANFDSLTGLPNRSKLNEQFDYILNMAKRDGTPFSLMFLDIDHFKEINDTLGHTIGDKLLIALAMRIKSSIRSTDMLARLGGDEHIILLPQTSADEVQQIAQKILKVVSQPLSIDEHELNVTASIGIAVFPEDGDDKETLFKNADIAMYLAKKEGRNGFVFFTEEMQNRSHRKLELVNAMHHAIAKKEFYLLFQPQVDLTTGSIVGVEALLRWRHSTLGEISPVEFIPVAENAGLIIEIGEWVLKEVIEQRQRWYEQGMKTLSIAVNLSNLQLRREGFYERMIEILSGARFPLELLELELSESAMLRRSDRVMEIMQKLHEYGVRVVIDDFGTGYSSLVYLKKFKATRLKIERSFIRDIMTDSDDRLIVDAVISMAHSLGLETVAAGVEDQQQLDYLREKCCDAVQGFYFSQPIGAEEFEHFYTKKLPEKQLMQTKADRIS